jgi:hypothetical protein
MLYVVSSKTGFEIPFTRVHKVQNASFLEISCYQLCAWESLGILEISLKSPTKFKYSSPQLQQHSPPLLWTIVPVQKGLISVISEQFISQLDVINVHDLLKSLTYFLHQTNILWNSIIKKTSISRNHKRQIWKTFLLQCYWYFLLNVGKEENIIRFEILIAIIKISFLGCDTI